MNNQVLLITTMYPGSLRPSTPVCHYFAREWEKMGYKVIVVYFRSMFPIIYSFAAKLFPYFAKRYVGNYVEKDRNMEMVVYEHEGIPVYSIPIFKYIPHGKYPQKSIINAVDSIEAIMSKNNFRPDVIVGHFYNPTLEVVGKLKKLHPAIKTCVSLHELHPEVIKKCYPKDYMSVIQGVDVIGFRSIPIKNRFVNMYGQCLNSVLCWSGTPEFFLNTPTVQKRTFSDGPLSTFLYVGQTIKRKFPRQTIEGVHKAMGNSFFTLTYVGSHDLAYPETAEYVETNHLSKKVQFIGKIPREEILRYYDSSDCFILISKGEVFGLVYLEAMSRGCITIASRNEGMEGIIEHGVNGFLCEAGNADELASIICHINNLSAKEKKAISDKARAKAAELSDYNVAKYYIDSVINCK